MRLRLLDEAFEERLRKIQKDMNKSINQMSLRTYVAKVERMTAPNQGSGREFQQTMGRRRRKVVLFFVYTSQYNK